jgi:hypothetical protein
MSVTVDEKVTRRPESWTFIYVVLGFALTIEGTIVQMIEPMRFPCNVVVYVGLMALTFWLFICNGPFQNKLLGMKQRYEDKPRNPN